MSKYEEAGKEIGALVDQKQAAYGDSFGKSGQVMRILYPKGIPPEQMDDALAVVRVLDKLFRIATDRDALGESPWSDIAGYGLLGKLRTSAPATLAAAPEPTPRCWRTYSYASGDRCELPDGHSGACGPREAAK